LPRAFKVKQAERIKRVTKTKQIIFGGMLNASASVVKTIIAYQVETR
jgi:hypothetical protein